MKTISLLLAAIGGAGFLYRSELQSLVHSPRQPAGDLLQHHQAPEGVCYLRTPWTFPTAEGSIRWAPGEELRVSSDVLATHGMITLTDGTNTSEVPQTAVTRDMDDAVALRQLVASGQNTGRLAAEREPALQAEAARQTESSRQANSNRIVSGQFHTTTLDAPTVRTNLPENIVSTAGGPVFYPVYGTVVIDRGNQRTRSSGAAVTTAPQRAARPVSTPAPVTRN